MPRYALIAGHGRFPLLALESARELGHDVVLIAIKEEAAPEVEALAARCYWISLGQFGRLIEILKQEGVAEVMMAGQVKHARLFSGILPDWRLLKLLATLPERNTDALIGAVASELEKEGIQLVDSTALLKPLLASEGPMTARQPGQDELAAIRYGRRIASALAGFDLGLRRAASLANGHPLCLVKSSRRRAHLLFDVPVAGLGTIPVMKETNTTVLAVDAGRTLLLDRDQMLAAADAAGLAILGLPPED
ncbi:MAG: UDP-2,3-diacylglucosamine diphosphatase LpxI [Bryobacteraceae bacterium]